MPQAQDWLDAVRHSTERLSTLLEPLSADEVTRPSYASEWTIADTASHLGSQAEIFALMLDAGVRGEPGPGREVFPGIWDRWNALEPIEQVQQSVAANQELVASLDAVDAGARDAFSIGGFGGGSMDFAELLAARLGELAVHTWDIAVALDPSAEVSADAVALLVDRLPTVTGRAGKPVPGVEPITLVTSDPERSFVLTVDEEAATLAPVGDPGADPLELPAEALVRLVFGRLDPEHTPADIDEAGIATLRPVFPGF